jgi:hypothetical protein
LPVGLVGLLPDNHIELIFDEQKEELRRRNKEVAQLLKEQRDDLAFMESLQQKSNGSLLKLNRQDSLPDETSTLPIGSSLSPVLDPSEFNSLQNRCVFIVSF